MNDLGWLLLWLAVAGYMLAAAVAFAAAGMICGLCAIWHRLRRLFLG